MTESRHAKHNQKDHGRKGQGGDDGGGGWSIKPGADPSAVLGGQGFRHIVDGRPLIPPADDIQAKPDALIKRAGAIAVANAMTADERSAVEAELAETIGGLMDTPFDERKITRPLTDDIVDAQQWAVNIAGPFPGSSLDAVEGQMSVGLAFQMRAIGKEINATGDYKLADGVSEAIDAHVQRYGAAKDRLRQEYPLGTVENNRKHIAGEKEAVRESLAQMSRDLEELTGVSVAAGWVAATHLSWTVSSQAPLAAAVQWEVAAQRGQPSLGGESSTGTSFEDVPRSMGWLASGTLDRAAAIRDAYPESVTAVVNAERRHTAEVMAAAGFQPGDTVTLYRGVDNGFSSAVGFDPDNPTVAESVNTNPLSSWTTDLATAKTFGAGNDGYVLQASVPIEDVFTSATLSGFGSRLEHEVIVMGGSVRAVDEVRGQEPVNIDEVGDADWIKKVTAAREAEHGTTEEEQPMNVTRVADRDHQHDDERSAQQAPEEEHRSLDFALEDVDERRDADGTTTLRFRGYAAAFDQPAVIRDWRGEFRESFDPAAFNRTLEHHRRSRRGAFSELRFLFDHGKHPLIGEFPLGAIRKAEPHKRGLYVEAEVRSNWLVQPVIDGIQLGAISGMSINFVAVGDQWADTGEGRTRRVTEAKLTELGPVLAPAYSGTEATLRSLAAQRDVIAAHHPELLTRPAWTGGNVSVTFPGTVPVTPAEGRSGGGMTTVEALALALRHHPTSTPN